MQSNPLAEDKANAAPASSGSPRRRDKKDAILNDGTRPERRWRRYIFAILIIVVLALALGLGLGLGLNGGPRQSTPTSSPPSSNNSPSNLTSSASPGSQASLDIPPWRSNVKDYTLSLADWDFNASPTTRSYHLILSEVEIAPDGVPRTVLAINGRFPGPVIRANRGDRLLIYVQNNMTNVTSVHWHGLFQNGTNWMDGTAGITQCPIPSGAGFLYNFTVENQFGTYWYHTHYSTANGDGPVGPLIVHAPEEGELQKLYEVDQIILLQDWYHAYSEALLPGYLASGNENTEPVPDNGLIQGTNYFNCSSLGSESGYPCRQNSSRAVFAVEHGKRYRYRLINTGAFATFEFSIDNHPLSIIEADGTAIEPLLVHRLEIGVAQRYSVVINANQSSATNYWMRAQMNEFCFGDDNPVLDPDVKALVTYTNSTDDPTNSTDWQDALDTQCVGLNASLLTPTFTSPAPPATTLYAVTSSFQIGAYAVDLAYINGTSWVMADVPTLNQAVASLRAGNNSVSTSGVSSGFSANQYVINVPDDAVVDLLVTNFDDGSHPFHLHGHAFWVLASSPDQYFDWKRYGELNTTLANPMRRDTLMIDAFGWALIRFVADNPGLWAFHCHISWHMEAGLLMQFQTRNDIMTSWTLPSSVTDLCATS
ncbi:uncharacterized protein Z518_05733 [Rhinocladiella mackenziei CBS 650.93]|uniref:Laccase n=1 Tax=Rhinocladiella mackenziei CBS 650.93 TaxID=1442369 RepID=A0A0D2FRR9_9EURO|nr:uncharacterized protein Z518_05733 [Rhinocladiella mackenziei CBS 650.93]KIX04862.1 hypothetical protein Z518_05733 [Rhinocladiella mackenziei CBS 650.93]